MLEVRQLGTLYNSFLIGVTVAGLTVLLGAILALITNFAQFRNRKLISTLLIIPLLIPPYIHALTWMNLARWVSDALPNWEITEYVIRTIPGAIWVLVWAYLPLAYFLIRQGLRQVPSAILHSGFIYLKARNFWSGIMVPLVLPAARWAFLLVFVLAFTNFDVPAFYEVPTFVTEIFAELSMHYNLTDALVMSVWPMLITLSVSILIIGMINSSPLFSNRVSQEDVISLIHGRWRVLGLGVTMFVLAMSVGLPVISILTGSLLNNTWSAFSQDLFISRQAIINSFWLALVGSGVLSLTALVSFTLMIRWKFIRAMSLVWLTLPAIVFGLSLIYIFNRPGLSFLYNSYFMLIFSYVLRFTPLIWLIWYEYHARISAGVWQSWRLVANTSVYRSENMANFFWPLYRPVIILSFVLGIWLVATELPLSILLQPPGGQTLMSRLFILLHYGSPELMNALTLILLLICLLPMSLVVIKSNQRI